MNVGVTVAVTPYPSVTWTVNDSRPGKPTNVPFSDRPFSVVPAGSAPLVRVYENGASPPLTCPNVPHTATHPSSTVHSVAQAGTREAASLGTMLIVLGRPAVLSASNTWTENAK
ncbi:MAG: hypothetical protein ABI334_03645 [Candidatus Dormiibacterota bacterium]